MRSPGPIPELQRRRLLAVQRVLDGSPIEEVADSLGVPRTTMSRWVAAFRARGTAGLAVGASPGRPRKLTTTQEEVVPRWRADDPTEHGFPTELGTAARIGQMIEQEFGVAFNPRYLSGWLRDRGFTPQKPQRVPRERDPVEIREWLATAGPRSKTRRGARGPTSP
jgi:transposase